MDNTFTGTLKRTGSGELISIKHKGRGLGTQSVRSIAAHYGGVCRFEVKDDMFCVSVMCSGK